jgi:hypothetical protein
LTWVDRTGAKNNGAKKGHPKIPPDAPGDDNTMEILFNPAKLLLATAKDVVPVLALLVFFQMVVLRQPIPRPGRIVFGFFLVLVGMACFLGGLDLALFPLPAANAITDSDNWSIKRRFLAASCGIRFRTYGPAFIPENRNPLISGSGNLAKYCPIYSEATAMTTKLAIIRNEFMPCFLPDQASDAKIGHHDHR